LQVNTTTADLLKQLSPVVAMDAAGNFVVVWTRNNPYVSSDADYLGNIYARLFKADGQALGSEFVVNSFTAANQGAPAVAMEPRGNFIVAWNGAGSGDGSGVFARLFDSNGQPRAADFRVNTFTDG